MNQRLLLIEDEEAIAIPLADRLRREGYQVESASDGLEGYERALADAFDLILLDLMLPRKNGMDVCRDLRQQGLGVPILMLTARTQTPEKVVALKLGADDYVTKPFEVAELLARIEALLRRASAPATAAGFVRRFGPVRIDLRRAEVTRHGQRVALSPKELQLLKYLAEHPDTVVSRDELLKEVWGYDITMSTRTVDVHVGWLRQKLEEDPKQPQLIQTVVGLGYRLNS